MGGHASMPIAEHVVAQGDLGRAATVEQTGDQPEQGGLACPVRPEDRCRGALRERLVQIEMRNSAVGPDPQTRTGVRRNVGHSAALSGARRRAWTATTTSSEISTSTRDSGIAAVGSSISAT